ncbi:hypothetical protein [Ferrimonas senticii]|uniref:hypothetical protein n=1 Tax=Ferrimonas senticii TaxID=394566 RepID=UPI0004266873|nr:hypothetical protein [Ferrimonas senticii]
MQVTNNVVSILEYHQRKLIQLRLQRDREFELYSLERLVAQIAERVKMIERQQTFERQAQIQQQAPEQPSWLLQHKPKFLFGK